MPTIFSKTMIITEMERYPGKILRESMQSVSTHFDYLLPKYQLYYSSIHILIKNQIKKNNFLTVYLRISSTLQKFRINNNDSYEEKYVNLTINHKKWGVNLKFKIANQENQYVKRRTKAIVKVSISL